MSLYHQHQFDPKSGKTERNRVSERMLDDMAESDPAPGAGLWDDTPLSLPNPWNIPTSAPLEITVGGALDWAGAKQKSAGTFPFSRLALHLHLRGVPLDTSGLWARGTGSNRSTVVAQVGGIEYRDLDGLIFEKEIK